MPPIDELYRALARADAAGDQEAVKYYADEIRRRVPQDTGMDGRTNVRSPAYIEGTQLPGATQAAANVLEGPLFNWTDEVAGLIAGTLAKAKGGDYWKEYEAARDRYRGAVAQARQDNPGLAIGGQIAGGMLTLPIVAATLPKGFNTAAPVAAGMGFGAANTAGEAETADEVPYAAGRGAIGGAVASGGLKATGAVLGAAGRAIGGRIPPVASGLARRRVGEAFLRDETDPLGVSARLATLPREEARIGDAAGRNTLSLLQNVAAQPGKTQNRVENLITNRLATRAERLDPILNPTGLRFSELWKTWQASKEAEAGPLYDAIRDKAIPTTGRMFDLLERPVMRDALAMTKVHAQNNNMVFPDVMKGERLTVGQWDLIKRGLGDVIDKIKRGEVDTSKATTTLRDATATKKELVAQLDMVAGAKYKQARDTFAGYAEVQSAMKDGLKAPTMTARAIEEATEGMSKSEIDAFRMGAREALREKVGKMSGQTELLNEWRDRATREKLQAIFGEDAQAVLKGLEGEAALRPMERVRVSANSATAPLQFGAEDLNAGVALDTAQAAHSGNALPLMFRLWENLKRTATPEPVRNEIGRIITAGNMTTPNAAFELNAIDAMIKQAAASQAAGKGATSLLGGSIPHYFGF